MKNKGFTLMELLGVIVILALLMTLVMPKIINSLKSSNDKVDDLTLEMIYNASELYIDAYADEFITENGFSYCIELNDLVGEGYLKSPININDTDVTNLKSIEITYQDGFSFELKDNGECAATKIDICTAVNSSESGKVEIGTQYNCDVDPNEEEDYTFYVLSTEGDSVNLIMSKNLEDGISFLNDSSFDPDDPEGYGVYSRDNYTASVPYAITYTETLTSNWDNVISLNESHTMGWAISAVNLKGKARLATYDEIAENICQTKIEKDYIDYDVTNEEEKYYYKDCPSWIKGDYWTMSTVGTAGIWAMNTTYNTLDSFCYENGSLRTSGIRPVITVRNFQLK